MHGATVPTGTLWVYSSHGWPYLPGNSTGHCTWGWPYLPASVQKTLISRPTNWEGFKARHQVKCTPWWYFSKETLRARRGWKEVFEVMKGKNLHPRLLYPEKLSFRMEGQIKSS